MNADEYLSILNPEQLEAVCHEGNALLILAGAGSGKTRVITTKIAYLIAEKGFDPRSILAVTFTKKAANEMSERAQLLESRAQYAQIRTFHSFGAWFLRTYGNRANIDPNFTVYDDNDTVTLLTKAVEGLSKQQASHFAHCIARAKDYCLLPDSDKLLTICNDPSFSYIYESYQNRLRETGNVDFGDLIMLPVHILQQHEAIRSQIHYRFKIIMVDEYQDANVAQFLLLRQLSSDNTYVCVVGDDDQSIYKFRGADVQNILTFQHHFAGTDIIKLERNYRSVPPILSIADTVVKSNVGRLGKTLRAERSGNKKPTLLFLPTQDVETEFCTQIIKQAHEQGCPYSHWAILYRTNAQSLGFETEFLHKKIPFTVVGSLKFYEREEIKDVLSFIAFIANPKDEIAFRRIINKPARGIGAVSVEKIIDLAKKNMRDNNDTGIAENLLSGCKHAGKSLSKKAQEGLQQFLDVIESLQSDIDLNTHDEHTETDEISEADTTQDIQSQKTERLSIFIENIAKKSGLTEYHTSKDEIAGTQRVANMQELANSAVLYPLTKKGLFDFLDHIELDRTLDMADEDENRDAVTLITLHNTKGLEFPRVIITGLEKGLFPRADKDEAEIEEERRLFYVGLTRAQDELYITSCAMRRMYGRTEYMQPSPFLYDIDRDSVDILGTPPPQFSQLTLNKAGEHMPLSAQKSELALKWKRGTKIFHDDWGYGYIIDTKGGTCADGSDDDNYVIHVQFENMQIKKFMPKFQSHTIMIIQD